MSIRKDALIEAYNKGYRVVNNEVISPFTENPRVLEKDINGYFQFSIRTSCNSRKNVYVHRLMAFQKFGEKLFEDGIEVRHLDGDRENNSHDNISIGTRSQNEFDKPKALRMKCSISASALTRKFSDLEIERIKEFHNGSYKETMEKFGITSKGTLHRLLNVQYKTKK